MILETGCDSSCLALSIGFGPVGAWKRKRPGIWN